MSESAPKTEKRNPRVEWPDPAIVEILRRKTPAERGEMIFAANRLMRERLAEHFQSLHPDWDGKRVQEEIARTVLDDRFMEQWEVESGFAEEWRSVIRQSG